MPLKGKAIATSCNTCIMVPSCTAIDDPVRSPATAGKRMFLTKVKEEKDSDLLYAIRRKNHGRNDTARYLVFFRIDTILPLVGSGDETEQ